MTAWSQVSLQTLADQLRKIWSIPGTGARVLETMSSSQELQQPTLRGSQATSTWYAFLTSSKASRACGMSSLLSGCTNVDSFRYLFRGQALPPYSERVSSISRLWGDKTSHMSTPYAVQYYHNTQLWVARSDESLINTVPTRYVLN